MRGQWNTENASVISADDAVEPTVAIRLETRLGGNEWFHRLRGCAIRTERASPGHSRRRHTSRIEATPPGLVVLDLSAAPRVDLQSAHALAAMAAEITAKGIRFQAVEARSSVRDRLRSEGIEGKFGNVNRFTTVADAVKNFQQTARMDA